MFPKSSGMKKIREDYQQKRWEAATTTFDLEEWSDEDIIEFDLDEGWTEGLPVPTGRDNPDSYRGDRAVGKSRRDVDVRSLKNR